MGCGGNNNRVFIMYKLQFTGILETGEQSPFVIFVKAETQQEAIAKVISQYQATNIQVIE